MLVVEVWQPGQDIVSNRYVGPFKSEATAWDFAEAVRHSFAEVLDARVIPLDSAWSPGTWDDINDWYERGRATASSLSVPRLQF